MLMQYFAALMAPPHGTLLSISSTFNASTLGQYFGAKKFQTEKTAL